MYDVRVTQVSYVGATLMTLISEPGEEHGSYTGPCHYWLRVVNVIWLTVLYDIGVFHKGDVESLHL